MQDPSAHVAPVVLGHVHLLSEYKFPVTATLTPQQALDYLVSAPKIVRDIAAVCWTYFQIPPSDGTVLLTWQTPQLETQFPSDGYVWADPEQRYQFEHRGYTLEIFMHRSGYRINYENMATHTRTRYRIIGKDPKAPGAFDPNLWIIHYGQANREHCIPVDRIPITLGMSRIIEHRQFIESQGQLLRKPFMLHDRASWPKVDLPQQQQSQSRASMYSGNPRQPIGAIGGQPPFYNPVPHQRVGPSPAKRQRHQPPAQMPGTAPGMAPLPDDDEDHTHLGDLMDHLTPREISAMRYKQHHEWMEEVFSSPYSAGRIQPVSLGLGLMGELGYLTKDILAAAHADVITKVEKKEQRTQTRVEYVHDPPAYEKLNPARVQEFEKRVQEHLEKEQVVLQKMKDEHAKKVADLKRSRVYVQAERRLRNAVWDESAILADGQQGTRQESAERIVQEVEKTLNVTVRPKEDVVCVAKGGFQEERPIPPAPAPAPAEDGTDNNDQSNDTTMGNYDSNSLNGLINEAAMDADNTAAGLLDQFGSNSVATTPAASLAAPAGQQSNSAAVTPADTGAPAQESSVADGQAPASASAAGDSLLAGMDIDVDMGGMDTANPADGDASKTEGDWVMVNQVDAPVADNQPAPSADAEQPSATASAGAPTVAGQEQPQQEQPAPTSAPGTEPKPSSATEPQGQAQNEQQQQQPPPPPPAESQPAAASGGGGSGGSGGSGGMFDTPPDFGTFTDFSAGGVAGGAEGPGADDDDDDGLGLDLGEGGQLIEDSAFGDALHGMDTHTPGAASGAGGPE